MIENFPYHIAIIMDGNGRWAEQRNKKRIYGHFVGSQVIDNVIKGCLDSKVKYLTLYTFSTENWKRPHHEVNFLLHLLNVNIRKKKNMFKEYGVRFRAIGDISVFSKNFQDTITDLENETKKYDNLTLTLALNYGSKDEIVSACKKIAKKVFDGDIKYNDINEKTIDEHLYTSTMPAVDLVIRTGGEKRISNFLTIQSAYAEFVFLEKYWPDFTKDDLFDAIDEFKLRKRRFGGLL